MKLLIDHREKNFKNLFENICKETRYVQLPIGDYIVISNSHAIVIERKTINDLFSSIRSNRLWDQLLRLMKTDEIFNYPVKRRILLIHGNFQEYLEPFLFFKNKLLTYWSQLMGAYMEILFVYNTPIICVENNGALRAFMRILIKRESSGINDKLPEARWYKKPVRADLPVKDRKKYILSSLPYIGDRLAENLLLHFNTIAKVALASVKDLEKVPKIGKKKANIIYKLFHS